VDAIVFLNRHHQGAPGLVPYDKELALEYMRHTLLGVPRQVAAQLRAMERLLAVNVYELRYSGLDEAVEQLRRLVRDGG
jgi:hypothetical protein